MKKLVAIVCILCTGICGLSAQVKNDTICDKDIHTIQLYVEGWEMSNPVIYLNSQDKLHLSFDDLSGNPKKLYYTIVHCNEKWEQENISYYEMAEGFESNPLTEYKYSVSTVVNYLHYNLIFPNENCKPLVSGNYMLVVFADNDMEKVVFQRKFYVVEKSAIIDFRIVRPEIARYMQRQHQFFLVVTPDVQNSIDLRSEIKAVVVQNFNFNTRKTCHLAQLQDNKILVYDNPDSNLFMGLNEFRNFDIKSIRYQSQHIKSISYLMNWYEVVLHPAPWRNKNQYFSEQDINGKFFIENSNGKTKDIDADYVMVYFRLPTTDSLENGNLYINGAFNNWQCNAYSRLKYDEVEHAYKISLLLKQGYYNYLFTYKETPSSIPDYVFVERSHYETENEYQALIYYQMPGERYERLIGYAVANSLHK